MGKNKLVDQIGQFTTIPNTIIRLWPDIGLDAFALFVCLRYHSDTNGESFPSYETISRETGIPRYRISDAIKSLVEHEIVEKRKRFGGSTVYTLKMPSHQDQNTCPVVGQADDSSMTVRLQSSDSPTLTRLTQLDSLNQTNTRENSQDKNSQTEEGEVRTTEDIKEMTIAHMAEGARKHAGLTDIGNFPADISDYIQLFCDDWNFTAPRTKSRKSKWIEDARNLKDACGEFGLEALHSYWEWFFADMQAHNGIAPHTVCSPGSLVNMVAKHAAKMREQKRCEVSQAAQPGVPEAVRRVKGEVTYRGQTYFDGVLIEGG